LPAAAPTQPELVQPRSDRSEKLVFINAMRAQPFWAGGPQRFRKRACDRIVLQDVVKKNGFTRGPKGGVSGKRPPKVTGSRARRPNDEDRIGGITHGTAGKSPWLMQFRIPLPIPAFALRDLPVWGSLVLRSSIILCGRSVVLGAIGKINPCVGRISFLAGV
jgi:hypothetical protein